MSTLYEAYYKSPQEIKDVIDSDTIGDFTRDLVNGTGYENQKSKIILLVASALLQTISSDEIESQLIRLGIEENTVKEFGPAIKKFLNILLHSISSQLNTLPDEIAEAEAALSAIPQVRTMPQSPAGSEPVYTSTQAAILHESTAAPAATDPSGPRWDTGH